MVLKTRIFELCDGKYKSISELAQAMDISVVQLYRVKEDESSINERFIIGVIEAFPEYNVSDLFYLND